MGIVRQEPSKDSPIVCRISQFRHRIDVCEVVSMPETEELGAKKKVKEQKLRAKIEVRLRASRKITGWITLVSRSGDTCEVSAVPVRSSSKKRNYSQTVE